MQETLPICSMKRTKACLKGFQFARREVSLSFCELPTSGKTEQPIRVAQTKPMGMSGRNGLSLEPLPAKVLQNCQRTGRVIIISELEKRVNKDKKDKMELHKILSEFLPKQADQEQGGFYDSKKYYQSLNYSRVRIGHKQFIKKILSNPIFQKPLSQIFDSDALYSSQKARKNERSPISFEQRKAILQKVLLDYKTKFQSLNQKQECCNESSTILQSCHILQQKQDSVQISIPIFKFSPLIPIPLSPFEYQSYMGSRKLVN